MSHLIPWQKWRDGKTTLLSDGFTIVHLPLLGSWLVLFEQSFLKDSRTCLAKKCKKGHRVRLTLDCSNVHTEASFPILRLQHHERFTTEQSESKAEKRKCICKGVNKQFSINQILRWQLGLFVHESHSNALPGLINFLSPLFVGQLVPMGVGSVARFLVLSIPNRVNRLKLE